MKPNTHDRMVAATVSSKQRAAFASVSRLFKAGFAKSSPRRPIAPTPKKLGKQSGAPGGRKPFRPNAKLDTSQIIDRRRKS